MDKHVFIISLLFGYGYSQMIFPNSQEYNDMSLNQNTNIKEKYILQNYGLLNNYYMNVVPENAAQQKNKISTGFNNFALNINRVLINRMSDSLEDNVLLSPLSLAGALSLLVLGSVGKTYDELSQALGFFNDLRNSRHIHEDFGSLIRSITRKGEYVSDFSRNISYASALFLQNDYSIDKEYENMVTNIYKSDINRVDFKNDGINAQWLINKWVYDQTNGKIQNILPSIPPLNTRLIIASALYFRAEWEKYFLDGLTKRSTFTPDKRNPGNSLIVDMMANEGRFPYYKSIEHECVLVGLPYKGNKTTLYAIKPLDSTRKTLKQILSEMNTETLNFLINNAKRQSTIVLFPKIKMTSSYNLKTVFQEMGINAIFSSSEANLALLTKKPSGIINEQNINDDRLIFSRIGGELPYEENCTQVLLGTNTSFTNCSTVEVVDGKKVTVVYKKIGDKIGRRIIKRHASQNYDNKRIKRQLFDEYLNPGLYVDEVIHKVDIGITETGTEAAAATMVLISRDGRRPVFVADEPFFFAIKDEETDLILFSGTVFKPMPNYT